MPTASVPIVPNSTVAMGQSMCEGSGFRDEDATRLRTGGGWDDRASCAGCLSSSACDAIVNGRIGSRRGIVRREIGRPGFHVGELCDRQAFGQDVELVFGEDSVEARDG